MKLPLFFLGAAFAVVINGQTDCDYDYVCDDTGSPGDLKLAAPSALACYQACKASVDINGDPDCLFWTYYEELGYGRSFDEETGTELDGVDGKLRANGKPVCRRLTRCDTTFDKSACGYTVGGAKCASGPGSCESCNICPPLTYGTGSTVAHWTCDIDFPYRKKGGVAEGTTCRTKCPSPLWAAGNVAHASCKEDCTNGGSDGIWQLSADTSGVTDSTGADVDPTIDPPCPCENIVLGANQVPADILDGSTQEVGAEFFCEAALIDSGSGNGLDTMDTDSKCKLFCNGHVALDIKCIAGSWTAGVTSNDDIYCWGPPLECDYNPGVNSEVCTCAQKADPSVKKICLPDQACNDGVCVAKICVPDPDTNVVAEDCFCQGSLGGASCTTGQTCIDGTCTT